MTRRLNMAAAVLALSAAARADEWSQMIGQTDQVTQGLVAYYSMRNSGTTVFDEWRGNNGGASNGVVFSYGNGVVGNGAYFDGVNDYVSIGTRGFGSSWTVSVWINPVLPISSADPVYGIYSILSGNNSPTLGVDSLGIVAAGVAIYGDRVGSSYVWTNFPGWHHVVYTYSSTNLSAWVDGAYLGVKSVSNPLSGTALRTVGIRDVEPISYHAFKGSLDELRIYSRVLSADEIRQLYRMGATPRRIKE